MERDALVQVWVDNELARKLDLIAERFRTTRVDVMRQATLAVVDDWVKHPSPFPVKQSPQG